jgi:alpha-L-rhamnosidase
MGKILGGLIRSVEIEWDRHLNVGILGAKYVPEVLAENGRIELAYEAITQETYPGYGYMIREGATTLWERWEKLAGSGMNSHNHHMLGSVNAWLYKYVAGIRVLEPGFKRFIIRIPEIQRVSHASASYNSIRGLIAVSWSYSEKGIRVDIRMPVGSIALIQVLTRWLRIEIKEGGKRIYRSDLGVVEKTPGITRVSEGSGLVEIEVGSGSYSFEILPAG